jgi:hypothetical protein
LSLLRLLSLLPLLSPLRLADPEPRRQLPPPLASERSSEPWTHAEAQTVASPQRIVYEALVWSPALMNT